MARIRISCRTLLLLSTLYALAASQSKRGLGYTGETEDSDNDLLFSENSPVSWYFTWSLYVASAINSTVPFVPLIHGLDDASNSELNTTLENLPGSSTHLFTFNEPDGTTSSGGSSIEPADAAQSYIDYVVPLRTADRSWNISHPVVTGSQQGLEWLQKFNESCYDIDSENGCPLDFVSVHWYGDFAGLASWVGTLNEFYNPSNSSSDSTELKLWITEMALPDQDDDATLAMMNQSLPYLDGLDYVEVYAWFGMFRADKANSFVGDNAALIDDDGGLTDVGALYLGGEANGFEEGMKGDESSATTTAHVSLWAVVAASLAMGLGLM